MIIKQLDCMAHPEDNYKNIIKKLIAFRNDRDWEQFHDARNLSLALILEASELNELFLWKKDSEIDTVNINRIKDELADVLIYSLLLAEKFDLDIFQIIEEKIKKNSIKYPLEKSKGSAKKYTDL